MLFDCADIKVKRRELRRLPDIPDTGWLPPAAFPNLSAATHLSVDVETYEPDFDNGPGWSKGIGHIVGFSVGAKAGNSVGKWYFPTRHTVGAELNLDEAQCMGWLKEQMKDNRPKAGANLTYDLGWLQEYGVEVGGNLYDTTFAEALLSPGTPVSLDHCAAKYLGEHKVSDDLYQWCADAYGGNPTGKQRSNIWRAPPQLVGFYGESDADLPLRVMEAQYPLLQRDGLEDVFRMECDLMRLMVAMRYKGMPVDLDKAEQLHDELEGDLVNEYAKLYQQTGIHASVNSGKDLARIFDTASIPYPYTDEGNPSFVKEFLEGVEHPIAKQILRVREYEKIRGTFVKSYILDSHVNGKVHGQFHQLKGDAGGAKTGRFASSCPNLQNIPSRTELGLRVRGLFVGEEGHAGVLAKDYSSVEYRILTHYAVGSSGDAVRQRFNDDPNTDYHQVVIDLIRDVTGIELSRKPAKNINFGTLYGAGIKKIAGMLKIGFKEAEELLEAYHKGAPYVKATMEYFMEQADQQGFITTIMGRRSNFDLWEPVKYSPDVKAVSYEIARARWGLGIKRAGLYKSTNYAIQGTAAEIMKNGMLQCWKQGIFDTTGVPIATVHDELVFSLIDRSSQQEEAYKEMEYILANNIKLKIPLTMDTEVANDWGSVSSTTWGSLAA